MSKKKGKYSYDESLEGKTVWTKEPITFDSNVTQKQLESLYKIGYKGVSKAEETE